MTAPLLSANDWPALPLDGARRYLAPPRRSTGLGVDRKVGLELEFGGVEVAPTMAAIADIFGGTVEQLQPTLGEVRGTRYGDFGVELDSTMFTERKYVESLRRVGLDIERDRVLAQAEETVLRVVREIIPFEVVTPPIPWSRLAELDVLWERLRAMGAQGTHARWHYSFGLHINVEIANSAPETLLAPLKAFLLLEPWLAKVADPALSRRVGPHIRPFPREYRELVLAVDYWPDWPRLIDDYLNYNPTRSRPLDLLPLFADRDLEAIRARVEDPHLVKPRPAFHYRLPNCDIDKPDWSPVDDWNRWVFVERVANSEALTTLCERFARAQQSLSLGDPWPDELEAWLAQCPSEAPDH